MSHIQNKMIILLLIMFVIIEALFMLVLMPELDRVSGEGMLDMSINNHESFGNILEAYHEKGLDVYNKMQLLDVFFPAVYGCLFYMILRKYKSKLWLLPLLTMGFDYLENMGIRLAIQTGHLFFINAVMMMTLLKFAGFTLSILVVTYVLIKKHFTK